MLLLWNLVPVVAVERTTGTWMLVTMHPHRVDDGKYYEKHYHIKEAALIDPLHATSF